MSLDVTATVKRVGNSLALFIPADKAREGHLREGDVVVARLEPEVPRLLGRFPGLAPWTARTKRDVWPDC